MKSNKVEASFPICLYGYEQKHGLALHILRTTLTNLLHTASANQSPLSHTGMQTGFFSIIVFPPISTFSFDIRPIKRSEYAYWAKLFSAFSVNSSSLLPLAHIFRVPKIENKAIFALSNKKLRKLVYSPLLVTSANDYRIEPPSVHYRNASETGAELSVSHSAVNWMFG